MVRIITSSAWSPRPNVLATPCLYSSVRMTPKAALEMQRASRGIPFALDASHGVTRNTR